MRIGEFAVLFGRKKTTIRYYTEQRLLLPVSGGGYPEYDERCIQDMKDVIGYQEMGFSLEEIAELKSIERFKIARPGSGEEKLTAKFLSKIDEHRRRINELENQVELLSRLLVTDEDPARTKKGLSFRLLEFLRCRHCGNSLKIENGLIENGEVLEGRLSCRCGSELILDGGILKPAAAVPDLEVLSIPSLDNDQLAALIRWDKKMEPIFDEWDHSRGVLFINADTELLMIGLHRHFRNDGCYAFVGTNEGECRKLQTKLEEAKIPGSFIFIVYDGSLPLTAPAYLVDVAGNLFDSVIGGSRFRIEDLKEHVAEVDEAVYLAYDFTAPTEKNLDMDHRRYMKHYENAGLEPVVSDFVTAFPRIGELIPAVPEEEECCLYLYRMKKRSR